MQIQQLALWTQIMCHSPGTWQNCPQVKLAGEELCQRKNCKTKLESQNPLEKNCVSLTWDQSWSLSREQLCQHHLGTIITVSLENNRTILTWKQSSQSHLGAIELPSLVNNRASLTWEQLRQCHLGTTVPVSLSKNHTRLTQEQSSHLGPIVPVSLGNNRVRVT